MKMTVLQTARVARNLLKTIKESNLDTLSALKKITGQSLDASADDRHASEEYVKVSIQPSNRGTKAIVLDYVRRAGGRQIEVRINEELGYSVIAIACEKKIDGYDCFDQNEDGDHIQDKKLMTTDFLEVVKELEKIELLN